VKAPDAAVPAQPGREKCLAAGPRQPPLLATILATEPTPAPLMAAFERVMPTTEATTQRGNPVERHRLDGLTCPFPLLPHISGLIDHDNRFLFQNQRIARQQAQGIPLRDVDQGPTPEEPGQAIQEGAPADQREPRTWRTQGNVQMQKILPEADGLYLVG
jgi:hypothetical protein